MHDCADRKCLIWLFIYENMHTTLGKRDHYEYLTNPAEQMSSQQVLGRLRKC